MSSPSVVSATSPSIARCPRCQSILGNLTGPYCLSSWAHKDNDVVIRGLSVIVCGSCGYEWSPLPIGKRDTRSVEQIIADARAQGARPLRCPTPGCGNLLAEIANGSEAGGEGIAIVQRQRRVIVGRELLFVSCHGCRQAIEPPFCFDAEARLQSLRIPASRAVPQPGRSMEVAGGLS